MSDDIKYSGDTEKLKYDFLVKHQDADEIILHHASGLPVKAIYHSIFTKGKFKELLDSHPLNKKERFGTDE